MINLTSWQRGIALTPDADPSKRMYLWFYEWTLFNAVNEGQHTRGLWESDIVIDEDKGQATIQQPGITLTVTTTDDGATLTLTMHNESQHDWPELAGIIPCFNPGHEKEVVPSESFFDEEHERTWFIAADGLSPLVARDIHFNHELRSQIDDEADDGSYVFSGKWPTSEVNATAGLLMRESDDRQWVTGISWDSYLSVQGHNPWRCMHHSIRVGPLAKGASRQVNGRIFLFQGTREDCLVKYQKAIAEQS